MSTPTPGERIRHLESIGAPVTYIASGGEVGFAAWWSYGPIGAVAVTVVAATDLNVVTQVLRVMFVVHEITGGGTNADEITATPGGGAVNLYNAGADTLTLTVGAGGDITVQRAAGVSTYNVLLFPMIWI